MKVYFETFGCQMNVSDTERAREALLGAGMELAEDSQSADVVMLNTCSVRERAERKVLARVDELRHLGKGRNQKIGIMGCVAQLEGENLFDKGGKVDVVLGTKAVKRLPELLTQVQDGHRRALDLGPGIVNDDQLVPLSVRHSRAVGFVPIIEGCNKFCAYCIVPYSRGRERSRPCAEILAEIGELRREGINEVHLIGQNVNSYHPASDNILASYEGKTPFSKLLRACAATGMPRIKFTTSFPRDFHSDIISAMEEYDNLCNWVHLPAQSGSNRILSAMRRGYTREEYLLKVERIRASFRQNSLTTDIIVGYPGESEDDFEQTLRLVEECQFDSCYIFKYSKRSGTPASLITNNTNEQIIRERFSKVETLQKSIQKKKLESMVGQVYEVLVEGVSARDRDLRFGHTTCHRIVNFSAEQTINTGQIVNVVIETSKEHSLLGHAIQA